MEMNTGYCKVVAIIQSITLDRVERSLQELGVPGLSVTCVKGYGEYVDFYSRDCMTTYARVEVFTSAKRAEAIAQAIMEAAHSGEKGDGIVAVLPVNKIYRIRKCAEVQPDEI